MPININTRGVFPRRGHLIGHVGILVPLGHIGDATVIAVAINGDNVHKTVVTTPGGGQIAQRFLTRFQQGHACPHQQDNSVRGGPTDRQFAKAGAGGCAIAVVTIVAGADNRRITQATGIFPGPATSADAGRNVALAINHDRIDDQCRPHAGGARVSETQGAMERRCKRAGKAQGGHWLAPTQTIRVRPLPSVMVLG